nr:copia protein [Tanacetum cinerariifolium]
TLLSQADIEIRRNLVPAAGDPTGSIVPTGGVPAGSDPTGSIVPTGGVLAGSSVPAGSIPASSVPAGGVLAGSLVSTAFGDPAASEGEHHSSSILDTWRSTVPSTDKEYQPSSVAKALADPDWVAAMQEEMQQFYHQQVWKLVPLPTGKIAIGTKWILKNKRDARGIVVRNKA